MYTIGSHFCPHYTRQGISHGPKPMSIGQLKTGKMSSFQMNPNTIFLGLMGVTGVGGGQGRNLTKDM
jgi:hypothetical protein